MTRKPGSQPQNEWDLDDSSWSPNTPLSALINLQPYKVSEDKHGHESMIAARMPKEVARWIAEIREAKGSPYKINADVARDALILGLRVISLRRKMSPEWKVYEQLAEVTRVVEQEASVYETEGSFAANLRVLVTNGREQDAKELLAKRVEVIKDNPDLLGNPNRLNILRNCLVRADLGNLLPKDEE